MPLSGDYVHQDGFNLNGIEATNGGRTLIVVQSSTGKLFRVSARTGVADEIELEGGDVANGDGLLLHRGTLYVVQNRSNQIAVIDLGRGARSGTIVRTLTDPRFDVPTTLATNGTRLYTVNARFGTPDPATATYDILRLDERLHHGHGKHHRHHGGCR